MKTPKPLWTWKEETADKKNNGKRIVLMLAGRDYLTTVWYPPWRNELERENATHICQTLNAAFERDNPACKCGHRKSCHQIAGLPGPCTECRCKRFSLGEPSP